MAGNNRIKGITIEINGDSTNLQKSLSAVDKSLKQTESSLKDVNKLLKMDPKNTEILEQKQKLLADAVGKTKERLEQLRSASEQANEALKNGTMSQDQYDSLQREIAETETKLKDLEDQAKNTDEALSTIGQAGTTLQNVGDKATETGKTLTKNVTTPIVAVGAASMAAFNEVDKGLDIVTRATGATGAELDSLHESMKTVYSEMPVTAEEAGAAIGEVNTRFGVTGKQLEDLSEIFLKFSSITGTDVATNVDNVDKIMKKYGVDASKTEQVLGLLTNASQKTGPNINQLESTLNSNGAALKEMGFDLTESVNLLAQLEANGVDSSTAMTGFKKAVANATKEGKSADEALAEMIDSIKNASSETDALAAATELFGAKGAPEMTQAIREGRLSLEDISGTLDQYSGKVDTTFQNTQSASDDAKIAFNNLKLAGSELGNSIGSVLSPIIKSLSEKLKDLKAWFDNLSPGMKETIVKVALIAATIGPLLIVIGKVITAVGTILKLFPAIKAGILAVNAALAANPIGAVIIAITALVAAFVLLWNNCESFRQFWINAWDAIKQTCEAAWNAISGFFSDAWNAIVSTFEGIGSWFSDRWNDVTAAFSTVSSFFEETFGSAWSAITTAFEAVGSFFSTCWDAVKAPFENAASWFEGIFDGVKEAIKAPINWIIDAINLVIGGLNKLSIDVPSWVPYFGGDTWGIDIAKVPRLATGAVIPPNQPFLAMLGDQRTGTNIEAPLETIKQALLDAMQQKGGAGNGQIIVPVYIGKERIETIVTQAITKNTFLSGGR